jgi:hypothetical protein
VSLLSPPPDASSPPGSRRPVVIGLSIAAAVALVATLVLVWRPSPPVPDAAPPAPEARDAPAPKAAPPAPVDEPVAPAPSAARPRRVPVAPAEAPPPPALAPGPELRVDSDVPGASVFVDRQYLGTTPLVTRDVTPGTKALNVSAEGHDGVAQTIEVAADAPTSVVVRLRDVRLQARIAVVHKHRMGRCEGELSATVDGLRYETSNANDGFSLPLADLEVFEVDYLQKNLRVKARGGRTWNFTDPGDQADPLFVFHRDVERARARLARP